MSTIAQFQYFWNTLYESAATPFDIEEPDEWIASLAARGKIRGNVLDAGCGPGRTSRYLASRGYKVLGVDISGNAVERAARKAAMTGNKAQFLQANLCELSGYSNQFDTVVDIGCLHSLAASDRGPYAAALHRLCRPGAVTYLRTFSLRNAKWSYPDSSHTPALSDREIRAAFQMNGWLIEELVEKEIELFTAEAERPKAYCWFAELRYA
jgi:2-polyprenyl-3-methyl-5-hydroxy-6-metoxy-1,4-benzoquinol methylase